MTRTAISVEMFGAIHAQTELFQLLSNYASESLPKTLERTTLIRENFWRTRNYRSVLLTFDTNKPKNKRKHPYGWHIYYASPTVLHFSEKLRKPDRWISRLSINLATKSYFELDDDEKRAIITEFVDKSADFIKSKSA